MSKSKITLPYELSLWEDKIAKGTITNDDGTTEEKSYLDEVKIAELGSDTSSFPGKAFNITFNRNINAINDLTFSLVDSYYDPKMREKVKNPLIEKIFNRTRIKLKYGEDEVGAPQWYDFIITEKTESKSEGKIIHTYTCTDRWVDELSRSGYNILLTEENGIGDIDYLAEKVLENSNFKYAPSKDGEFKETKIVRKLINGELVEEVEDVPVKISKYNEELGRIVDRYKYSYIDEDGKEVSDDKYEGKEIWGFTTDEIIFTGGVRNWLYNGQYYLDISGWKPTATILENEIDGKTINTCELKTYTTTDTIKQNFMNVVPTFAELVSPSGQGTEWKTSETLSFYNETMKSADFEFEAGKQYVIHIHYNARNWTGSNNSPYWIKIGLSTTTDLETSDIAPFRWIYGFESGAPGAGHGPASTDFYYFFTALKTARGAYLNLGFPNSTSPHLHDQDNCDSWNYYTLKEIEVFPLERTNDSPQPGYSLPSPGELKVVTAEYFNAYYYSNTGPKLLILPFGPEEELPLSYIREQNYYFIENDNEIEYIDPSKIDSNCEMTLRYKENGKKSRSLIKEKSNRYSLLQELSELFEGWVKIIPEYYSNGKIKLDDKFEYEIYISFKESVDKETGRVFEYGKNTNSIERNINSKEIVTKLWVQESETTDSETGLTSIAAAEDNLLGDVFIYDFSYYLENGFLDSEKFNQIAYDEENGFYSKSATVKNKLQAAQLEQDLLFNESIQNLIVEREYLIQKISALKDEAYKIGNLFRRNQELAALYDGEYFELIPTGAWDDSYVYYLWDEDVNSETIKNYLKQAQIDGREIDLKYHSLIQTNLLLGYKQFLDTAQTQPNDISYATIEDGKADELPFNDDDYENENAAYLPRYRSYEKIINELKKEKEQLTLDFEQNFQGFINDGTWSDDNYTDSNAYYLDALSVLKKSAKPTVSYTIDVAKTDRDYKIGDKIPLIDRDLFGFDSYGAPTKEMMVLTEISDTIDSTEDFSITVQNFRSEFEDFFSKISASVQTVQSKDGMYSRAANFTADGQISSSVLQNTLNNNNIVFGSSENGITSDKTGITLKSNENKSKVVRLIADGIFASKDGGINWTTGITADGISGDFITAGQINTNLVQIMNKQTPTFTWDALGITALELLDNPASSTTPYSGSIVRMDQHGLYFVSPVNSSKFDYNIAAENNSERVPWFQSKIALSEYLDNGNITKSKRVDFVRDFSDVSLTWKGLLIKSSDGTSQLSTEANNITIKSGEESPIDRIILGKNNTTNKYGLFIFNDSGDNVFSTDENGNLTITGKIMAETGEIGGWTIEEDNFNNGSIFLRTYANETDEDRRVIYSSNGNFYITESGYLYAEAGGSFKGTITATDGKIGNWNIEDGKINSGKIFLDSNYGSGAGAIYMMDKGIKKWQIDGYGNASFENANISGTLSAVSFKYNEVQASSGAILVRPATKIASWDGEYYIHLDTEASSINLQTGDYFVIQTTSGNKYYGFVSEAENSNSIVNISSLYNEDYVPKPDGTFPTAVSFDNVSDLTDGTFVNLGHEDTTSIVINGGEEQALGFGESITFYKNLLKEDGPSYQQKYFDKDYTTVLGNLDGVGKKGFGLYSDNVYLEGELGGKKTNVLKDFLLNGGYIEAYPYGEWDKSINLVQGTKYEKGYLANNFKLDFTLDFERYDGPYAFTGTFTFWVRDNQNKAILYSIPAETNGKQNFGQDTKITFTPEKATIKYGDNILEVVSQKPEDFNYNNLVYLEVLKAAQNNSNDKVATPVFRNIVLQVYSDYGYSFNAKSGDNLIIAAPLLNGELSLDNSFMKIASNGTSYFRELQIKNLSSGKLDAGSLSDLT